MSIPTQPLAPAAPTYRNGLGVTALVLGLVGLALSWIPIVNIIAVILGILGLIFAIIGFVRLSGKHANNPVVTVIGAVTSLAAIIVSFIAFGTFADALNESLNDPGTSAAVEEEEPAADPVEEAPAEEESSDDGGDAAEADPESYAIGDTAAMGDLEHIVHSARWVEGNEFLGPEDGMRWLALDIEITNTGEDSAAVSSLMMWSLVDADNRTLDIALTDQQEGSLDGELGADRSMRGEIVHSVPEDQESWELIFAPDLLDFGQAIYTVTAADLE